MLLSSLDYEKLKLRISVACGVDSKIGALLLGCLKGDSVCGDEGEEEGDGDEEGGVGGTGVNVSSILFFGFRRL